MTTTDYENIAQAIKQVRAEIVTDNASPHETQGACRVTVALCQLFSQSDDKFDLTRFLVNCGY